MVVWGSFGLFGIGFSTISAQSGGQRQDIFAMLCTARPPVHSRRKRSGAEQESGFDDPEALPTAGAASAGIQDVAHQKWLATAARAGIDLSGFDPLATLAQRIAWARGKGLDIATVLARYSKALQHSTRAQVEDDVEFAAWNHMYPPPEFINVDEGVSGRKLPRWTGSLQADSSAAVGRRAPGV